MNEKTTTTFGKKGQVIHGQAREMIAKVIQFMKDEADLYQKSRELRIPVTSYKQRVMDATGISDTTYRSIVKEAKAVASNESCSFSSPRSRKKKLNDNGKNEDEFKFTSDDDSMQEQFYEEELNLTQEYEEESNLTQEYEEESNLTQEYEEESNLTQEHEESNIFKIEIKEEVHDTYEEDMENSIRTATIEFPESRKRTHEEEDPIYTNSLHKRQSESYENRNNDDNSTSFTSEFYIKEEPDEYLTNDLIDE